MICPFVVHEAAVAHGAVDDHMPARRRTASPGALTVRRRRGDRGAGRARWPALLPRRRGHPAARPPRRGQDLLRAGALPRPGRAARGRLAHLHPGQHLPRPPDGASPRLLPRRARTHDLDDIGVPDILDEVCDGTAVALVEWPGRCCRPWARTPRLELLVAAGRGPDERTWHLRGVPELPAAWARARSGGGTGHAEPGPGHRHPLGPLRPGRRRPAAGLPAPQRAAAATPTPCCR